MTGAITARINKLDLEMKMPQSVMLDVFHDLNDKWAVLGSVGWEQWSKFGYLDVSVNDSPNATKELDFDDTWHVGIGAQYKYTPKWTLNAGFSFDSELSSDKHRALALPMGKMYSLGGGTEYRKRNDLTIGAAMDVMWEGDLPVNIFTNGGQVSGEYEDVFITFFTIYAKW